MFYHPIGLGPIGSRICLGDPEQITDSLMKGCSKLSTMTIVKSYGCTML